MHVHCKKLLTDEKRKLTYISLHTGFVGEKLRSQRLDPVSGSLNRSTRMALGAWLKAEVDRHTQRPFV